MNRGAWWAHKQSDMTEHAYTHTHTHTHTHELGAYSPWSHKQDMTEHTHTHVSGLGPINYNQRLLYYLSYWSAMV